MKIKIFKDDKLKETIEISDKDLNLGGEVFIGRSDDCHVVLDERNVSRYHACLYNENGDLKVRKMSQEGPIQVRGLSIELESIFENDVISIGEFNLHFNGLDEATKTFDISQTLEKSRSEVIEKASPLEEPTLDEVQEELREMESAKSSEPKLEMTDFDSEFDEKSVVTTLDANAELSQVMGFDDQTLQEDVIGDYSNENFEENEDGDDKEFSSEEDSSLGDETESGFDSEDDPFATEDDPFSDGSEDSAGDSTQVMQRFAQYTLSLDGKYAPFDKYLIEENEIFIGRDPEKCQIILNDQDVSGVHAVIKKNLVSCVLEDLGSANGTKINGDRVNKAELTNGDNFQIGSTYFGVSVSSDLLNVESGRLMPVADDQEVEVEEVIEEEVDFDELAPGDEYQLGAEEKPKSLVARFKKDPVFRKKALIVLVGLALVLLLVDDEPAKKKPKKEGKTADSKSAESDTSAAPVEMSPETLEQVEQDYSLALAKFEAGEYYEARELLERIKLIDPNYKDTATLRQLVQQGYEELTRKKEEEKAEKERRERQQKIDKLLEEARVAVKEREVITAESLFAQILELDPENIDVTQLRLEIEAYKKEQERLKQEKAIKEAKRKAQLDALRPGKTLYLREDWFKAINALEKFLQAKDLDEDLVTEATDMIKDSKVKLKNLIEPLLQKAKSLEEGQDLKMAYETFGEVLRIDPSIVIALNGRERISSKLTRRSRKLYREALISESLSLFEQAKEQFQEVQQLSPINSEYYNKATDKLKDYLD